MVGNNWEEKRNVIRFPTDLKALYYLKEERESVEKCTIVDVSYKGFGIAFHRGEKINTGAQINIGIVVKWQFMPISVRAVLKWLDEGMDRCTAGVELTESLEHITLMKLF
jgi:hypothetical protein